MRPVTTLGLLDILRPEWLPDPYPLLRLLRGRHDTFWDEGMRSWVVLDYENVSRLSKDTRLSGDRISEFHQRLPSGVERDLRELSDILSDMMLFNEPPRHTVLRKLIRPALAPRFIRDIRPMIENLANALLDRVADRDRFDVIADYSEPLTRGAIAELAGIPAESAYLLENWQGLMHEFFTQSTRQMPRIHALREVFDGGRAQRAAGTIPGRFSEVVGDQVRAESVSEDEVFANFLLLVDAGQATTTHLIANSVLALLRHPDQLRLLRERPQLTANAAHEFLRYDASVLYTSRIALTDMEVAGHRIRQGQSVTLVLGSANRDERHYPDPDRLDVTRKAADHLSFGHGIHYCLGAALALTEAEIAISVLLSRFDDLALAEPEPEWLESINFRFLRRLPVLVR
ncbi:cytochrome P450 [Actinophytocola sp.]|uniref:cytochrome P450 n=1 Tax=Actinophytocola sp. TaxID=1872138 RepID=UPI00389A0431